MAGEGGDFGQVMTVTGPVGAGDLGVTLPHEHVFADLLAEYRSDGVLNDEALAVDEVARFAASGGRTIVDLSTGEIGRNPSGLRRVAQATGVHIVMGCGHYRDPYLDRAWFDRMSVDAIADQLVDEIEHGVGPDAVRPGIIGEIGADQRHISAAEERSFRAAARAHARTGLTISTHAARHPVGLAQLDLLEHEGVNPARVIVGHCDTVPDAAYHAALAARGCFLAFDGFGSDAAHDERRALGFIAALAEQGHLGRVLVSHDNFLPRHLHAYGGNGYDYITTTLVSELRALGLDEAEVGSILVDNPRRALTGAR